jgi:hypothetical protein
LVVLFVAENVVREGMRGFGLPRKVIRGDREFPRATVLFSSSSSSSVRDPQGE